MLKRGYVLLLLLFVVSLILCPFSFAQEVDPVADLPSQDESVDSGIYTTEDFSALSDDEKREVYLNLPERLPDGFDPMQYMDIFHPSE